MYIWYEQSQLQWNITLVLLSVDCFVKIHNNLLKGLVYIIIATQADTQPWEIIMKGVICTVGNTHPGCSYIPYTWLWTCIGDFPSTDLLLGSLRVSLWPVIPHPVVIGDHVVRWLGETDQLVHEMLCLFVKEWLKMTAKLSTLKVNSVKKVKQLIWNERVYNKARPIK